MTYEDLIRIADRHYPDRAVMDAYEAGRPAGDTMAYYIVSDLVGCDQENPADPLEVAVRRFNSSIGELMAVSDGLEAERRKLLEAESEASDRADVGSD